MNKANKTALPVIAVIIGMFAFVFAAFPLYNLFCKATGYGGTPKISANTTGNIGTQTIKVRFNADIDHNLSWEFISLQNQVSIKTGETKLVFFRAKNISDTPSTGIATFNVTPLEAGQYFNKIQCFCFNKQTLQPGQEINMPVSFYVDPAIEKNLDLKGIDTITLSYTFFPKD